MARTYSSQQEAIAVSEDAARQAMFLAAGNRHDAVRNLRLWRGGNLARAVAYAAEQTLTQQQKDRGVIFWDEVP